MAAVLRTVQPMSAGETTEVWQHQALTVIVFGASGDLAKKKTFPSLFDLFLAGFLPLSTVICGYARSPKSDEEFRSHLLPFLTKRGADEARLAEFLAICFYRNGQYADNAALSGAVQFCEGLHALAGSVGARHQVENRVFYLALPPRAFVETSANIKAVGLSASGTSRVVVEKPFGHDTGSAALLREQLQAIFSEDKLYRIDHYLGKEMVQNMMVLRFGNAFLSKLWSREHVSSVVITFKEDFGTLGRGGYFDSSGIIRDVMQNHLMQVLSIVAMEPPVKVSGTNYSKYVRDEKVKVLKCMRPIKLEDTVVGQYVSNGTEAGYLDDATVPAGSVCPTFCCAVMYIDNPRWEGVPFIMKAGKALNARKAEVRMQLRGAPGGRAMFDGLDVPRNELVIRLQPDEAIYMKTNVKRPGLHTQPVQAELDLSYSSRYPATQVTDAYTRLLLDVLRGKQATFVRDDELMAAWEIFTPMLHGLEQNNVVPEPYSYGGRGPASADELIKKAGYVRHNEYDADWKRARSLSEISSASASANAATPKEGSSAGKL